MFKKYVRMAAEFLFRHVVIRRNVALGSKKVCVFLTPASQLKYFGFVFDNDLKKVVRDHVENGSLVLDIGANCGVFGLMATLKSCRSIMFEPDQMLANLLYRSLKKNKLLSHSTIVNSAVSDKCGFVSFNIAVRGRASNAMEGYGGTQMGGVRERILVPVTKVDALNLDPFCDLPFFFKIDVEGAELKVLDGAIETINKYKPKIYIECSVDTYKSAKKILVNMGYFEEFKSGKNSLFVWRVNNQVS